MTGDKFDSFLSSSLKATEIEVNTPTNELERIIADKISVNKRMKKQRQLRLIQIAAAVILLLGISGAVFFPNQVFAIKKQLFQTILNIGKSINISLNSDPAQLKQDNQIIEQVRSVQQKTPFKILIPHYIPPGYSLESINRVSTDEQAGIVMAFAAQNSTILLTQTRVSENFSSAVNADAREAKAKPVMVGEYEGNLISFNDGSATLIWVTDDHIMCEILGDVSPGQAMEMANSVE